jgi:tetratricopeptide (TPR) repeat protein
MNLVEAVNSVLDEIGRPAPHDFEHRMVALLDRIGFDVDAPGRPSAGEIAHAWKKFMRINIAPEVRNGLEYLCTAGAFNRLTADFDPDFGPAFYQEKLSFTRSRLEMALRYGIALFKFGRPFAHRNPGGDDGRLVRLAITYFDRAATDTSRMQPPSMRLLFGMRGVANILIARLERNPDLFRQGAADLECARDHGDASTENRVYRHECASRIYELVQDPAALDLMKSLLDEGDRGTRQHLADTARYEQFVASRAIHEGTAGADSHVEAGLAACEKALALPMQQGASDEMLLSLRGFLYFLKSELVGLDPVAAIAALDAAVADLRQAASGGFGGASLARALQRRGAILKATDLKAARTDLEEALASLGGGNQEAVARTRLQIESSLLDLSLREKIANLEYDGLLETCEALLGYEQQAARHTLRITRALRICWTELDGTPPPALLSLSQRALDLTPSPRDPVWTDARLGFVLCDAACLSHRLDQGAPSARTLELFREGLARHIGPLASVLGQAGDAALEAGQYHARLGRSSEAAPYFQDAINRYEAALASVTEDDVGFSPMVCHSKLGLAYLRLRVDATDAERVVRQAIFHFETSRALGNETPHLIGLLGDAHYRIGNQLSDLTELRTALDYKRRALSMGSDSREAHSIMGRICHLLFKIEGGPDHLTEAIIETLRAQDASVQWPWPLFQLAEFAEATESDRQAVVPNLSQDLRERAEIALFEAGNSTRLRELAVQVAIGNEEFKQAVLGGRSGVYVLDDPHRLLSRSMVFKPTKRGNASTEVELVKGLSAFIRERKLARKFGLPIPISVVEAGGEKVVYAMQRTRGEGLHRVIMGESDSGYHGEAEVGRALEFLALFHSWAGRKERPKSGNRSLATSFTTYVKDLGFGEVEARQMANDFDWLLPPGLPYVRKKDAHPENWLVGPYGRIIMLDLEASATVPCLLEVAQLIDDYPVLPASDAGWEARLALCAKYWDKTFGEPVPDFAGQAFGAFVVFRCAFGLFYCGHKLNRGGASPALHMYENRRRHYRALLEYMGSRATIPAKLLADKLRSALPAA